MIRRFLLVALGVSYAGVAAAQTPPVVEEEDDPAFARQPPPPPPPEEEDPGFVDAPPLPPEDDHATTAAPPPPPRDTLARRRRPSAPAGMKLRLGYRTFTLDEMAMPGVEKTDRFHALSLDAYPISSSVRVGLVSHFGMESSKNDWSGAVGLALGIQRVARVTPFGEVRVHTGLTRRTFCIATSFESDCQDHLTLLWGFGLEAGVDMTLSGKTRATVALGIERNQYFAAEAENEMGMLSVFTDATFTVKVGIGY